MYNEKRENDPTLEQRYCTYSFINTFDPLCNLIDLVNNKSLVNFGLEMKLFNSDQVTVEFDCDLPFLKVERVVKSDNQNTVFIPSMEMMIFLPDFMSLMNKYELRIDQNYQNTLTNIMLPWVVDDTFTDTTRSILQDIKGALGGTFQTFDDLSMIFQENGVSRPAKLMSEGFRKFGLLSRLIETGCISPGVSGTLLWDEPETNLNPKLMRAMAEILIKFARAGQQLILVTHSYVFMKWFELLVDKGEHELILFHNLYRDKKTSEIKIETARNYVDIKSNSIDATYEAILDTQLKKDMTEF